MHNIIPYILFFLDLSFAVHYHQWFLFSLLTLFITTLVAPRKTNSLQMLITSSLLLIMLDFIRFGRFGLIIPLLIALYLVSFHLKRILLCSPMGLLIINNLFFFGVQDLFIVPILTGGKEAFLVTVAKISVNLIIGCVILGGMQGNRFPIVIAKGKRKVWTPNRKDAS